MANKNVEVLGQLWGEGAIRAFISHKAEDKELAAGMKKQLAIYSVASFVAHEDIEPLKEWEPEIERALFSMDLLIALLTKKFSDSSWTDQEIGMAIGRKILVIPVRIGKDPYGLIGKYQAIRRSVNNDMQISQGIVEFLFKYQGDNLRLRELAKDTYVSAVGKAGSFDRANYLSGFLPGFDTLSSTQAKSLVEAFNDNRQVYQANSFYPIAAGELSRMTGDEYTLVRDKYDRGTRSLKRAQ